MAACSFQDLSQIAASAVTLDGATQQCQQLVHMCGNELAVREHDASSRQVRHCTGVERQMRGAQASAVQPPNRCRCPAASLCCPNAQAFLNLCWAHAMADAPGTPMFRATVLRMLEDPSLQQAMRTGLHRGGPHARRLHQLYSYLVVSKQSCWHALRCSWAAGQCHGTRA